jgi:hypothetical protein
MTYLLRRFPTVAVGLAFSPRLIDLAVPHSAARERWLVSNSNSKDHLMISNRLSKPSDAAAADRSPGPENTTEVCDLSEFSQRVSQGATANDAKRIFTAEQEDDLVDAQMNRSFKAILKSLPIDDFDREYLELVRDYLVKRCERARKAVAFTEALSDVRQLARLQAKIAMIDVLLSSEVTGLIERSLRHKVS